MENDPATSQWHLDKRLNVGIILGLGLNIIVTSVWAGRMAERMEQAENRILALTQRQITLDGRISAEERNVAVLVSQLQNTNEGLDRLRRQLEATNTLLGELVVRNGPN